MLSPFSPLLWHSVVPEPDFSYSASFLLRGRLNAKSSQDFSGLLVFRVF